MINFKDDLNKELSFVTCDTSPDELISKAKPKHNRSYFIPRIAAAGLVLVLLAGICFMPNLFTETKNNFTIYAGAVEITDDKYVVIDSNASNFVKFNFLEELDKTADPTEITKKYLFHSFEKNFNLKITGENIDGFIFLVNNGSLTCYELLENNEYDSETMEVSNIDNSYSKEDSHISLPYHQQNNLVFKINPVCPTDGLGRTAYGLNELIPYIALAGTGEIVTDEKFREFLPHKTHIDAESLGYSPIAYGYNYFTPHAATSEEIIELKKFANADDMVGFYNYQNQIFKRLIDRMSVDILVRKNDRSKYYYETVRLQFCYNPIEVTEADVATGNHSESLSKGTLSAMLVDIPDHRQTELLERYNIE
ncbi:MAG: hypothetical protein IKK10_03305 [Clostridia bacterium]|nr:hypothetical protein [Clostridia bacterium]